MDPNNKPTLAELEAELNRLEAERDAIRARLAELEAAANERGCGNDCECSDCEADKCPYCDGPARKDENCCHYCIGCEDYERYHEVEGWTDSDDGELCPSCSAKTEE
jgi:hypothetical protein